MFSTQFNTKLPAIPLLHHSFFKNSPPLLVVRGIEYNRAVSTMVSLGNLRNHEYNNNRFNEQRDKNFKDLISILC